MRILKAFFRKLFRRERTLEEAIELFYKTSSSGDCSPEEIEALSIADIPVESILPWGGVSEQAASRERDRWRTLIEKEADEFWESGQSARDARSARELKLISTAFRSLLWEEERDE